MKENPLMSQRINLLAAVVVAFMLVNVHVGDAQTSQNSNTDEAAIRKVVQQLQDGWNAHDAKTHAAAFAPDADYVVVNGSHDKGREEIQARHTQLFTGIYKNSRNVATIKSIRFLRPDVAVVHSEWNLVFDLSDAETRKGHALSTIVMTKEKGSWSITAFQNTPIRTEGR
jgi:uncharacterized protein (TIGR02246 family)